MHRCDNRKCVNPEHLSVGTAQDNRNDMNAKMRHAHGERVNTAKLTEADVKRMYDLLDLGKGTPTVARMFGVSIANAWNIKTGKSWQHLYKARYGSNDAV